MIETIMSSEIWALIVAIAPAVGSVLGIVITVLLGIKKFAAEISRLRESSELKELIAINKQQINENKQLRKLNEKLIAELTKIRPVGYTDDKEGD